MDRNEPGDPIGLKAIQFLMHGATQSNLSYFHSAGTSYMSISPTVQQLLDVSKHPICRTILYYDYNTLPKWKLLRSSLWSFVKSIDIMDDFEEDDWYDVGREMELIRIVYEEDTAVFRIVFDYERLCSMEIKLADIATCFKDYVLAVSPDIIGIIDIHTDDVSSIINLVSILRSVKFGIEDIHSVKENICEGSNLKDLYQLSEIDSKRTISNHIYDVYHTLGIEAARDILVEELERNMEGNTSYASIIADFMTREGYLNSFAKGKMFDQEKGILLSMALERPSNDIQKMAYGPIRDNLNNSYSRLMIGKSPAIGTGYIDTLIDESEV